MLHAREVLYNILSITQSYTVTLKSLVIEIRYETHYLYMAQVFICINNMIHTYDVAFPKCGPVETYEADLMDESCIGPTVYEQIGEPIMIYYN